MSTEFNRLVCDNYNFWYNKILKDFGWEYTGKENLQSIKKNYKDISYWYNNSYRLTDEIILKTPGLINLTELL